MILENNKQTNLHFLLESKFLVKGSASMKILLSTLQADTEKASNSTIEKITNIYIYYYSFTKKWIKTRKTLKIDDKLKDLYLLFHSIISISYNLYKTNIQKILESDNDIVDLLLNDFENPVVEDDVKKCIFDILIEVVKFKNLQNSDPIQFNKIIKFSFDHCIKGSLFIKKIASKFIIESFEKMNQNTHAIFEEKIEEFFSTWFLNNNDFPAFLSLLFKTISFLNKNFKEKIIANLLTIIKNKSTIETKTKIFLLLEKIFVETLFSDSLIEEVIVNYIEFYEAQINIFLHEKLFFAFTQSYLQTVVSFYNSSPETAKKYIPSFISYVLEFFGDNNYSNNYKEKDQKAEFETKYKNYKQLAVNSFDILISSCFDANLFKELQSEDEAENEIMKILMNNMNVNNFENLSEFSQKTTVSKVFVLFLHSVSKRFNHNSETINKILIIFFKQLRTLDLKASKIFNDFLICFYKSIRLSENQSEQKNLLLAEILMNLNVGYFLQTCFELKNNEKDINQCYEKLNEIIDDQEETNEIQIEQRIREIIMSDNRGNDLLENSEFLYFLYIIEKYCGKLEFFDFFNYLRPIFTLTLDSINFKFKNNPHLKTEDIKKNAEFVNERRFLKTFTKFSSFNTCPVNSFPSYLSFFYIYSFKSELSNEFKKFIMIMFQNFLIHLLNNFQNSPFFKFITKYTKKNLLFVQIIKGFLTSENSGIKLNHVNLLRLFSSILDKQYIISLLSKNLDKLNRNLLSENLDNNLKLVSIKESEIIVEILSSLSEVHQFNEVFHQCLNLSKNLLNLNLKDSNNFGMKILEGLIRNCHQNFYKQIEGIFKLKLQNFLQSKNQHIDFNSNALKFLSTLLNSLKLNSLNLKAKILEFADSYLNFIVFNLKSRNIKNRDFVKEIIENIFNYYAENETENVIDSSNLLLARIIAGFAGESDYIKSCTLECIGFIYKKFAYLLTEELTQNFLEFAFLLLNEKKKEIFVSITKFLKYYFKYMKNENLLENLENILDMIYEIDKDNFQYFRNKLKTLLLILLKKFPREALEEKLTGEWRKLYRNVFKTEKQKVNKTQKEKEEKKNAQVKEKNEKEKKEQKEMELEEIPEQKEKRQQVAKEDKEINQLIYDFENERYFFNTRGAQKKTKKREKAELVEKNNFDMVYYDKKSKKIIIKQQKVKSETGHKRTLEAFENDNVNKHLEKLKKINTNKDAIVGTHLGARVLKRIKMTTMKSNDKIHFMQQTGEVYKSKTSGSDMKLLNKPDPHAFVQFNPIALSKKMRSKASKTFEVLMRKKKSGVLKGMKIKQ